MVGEKRRDFRIPDDKPVIPAIGDHPLVVDPVTGETVERKAYKMRTVTAQTDMVKLAELVWADAAGITESTYVPAAMARRSKRSLARRIFGAGLGDVVKNLAGLIGIKPCSACEKRRRKLNKLFAFGSIDGNDAVSKESNRVKRFGFGGRDDGKSGMDVDKR